MSSVASEVKARLRADILARRAARSPSARSAAGAAITAHVLAAWPEVHTVAAYLSLASEPPTAELIAAYLAREVAVIVPVVAGEDLDWARYDGNSPAVPGPLGIVAPSGDRLGPTALTAVDLVIVPALAVDGAGQRLGRGRGYYDRALTAVTAPVVAVIFDDELLADLPVEAHDRRVDAAVRPAGIVHADRHG
ncbi:MAG TPA: 5-formyltetrahydrofolate cyclo-ligase [Mycobacteriales bacterium]|nr:5-formyltetrahydrofolate cyclo-ligase [Mycobacteriales bacterium]